jgi:hypothetical protein
VDWRSIARGRGVVVVVDGSRPNRECLKLTFERRGEGKARTSTRGVAELKVGSGSSGQWKVNKKLPLSQQAVFRESVLE